MCRERAARVGRARVPAGARPQGRLAAGCGTCLRCARCRRPGWPSAAHPRRWTRPGSGCSRPRRPAPDDRPPPATGWSSQEQDAVAVRLGLLDADALLRRVSEAGRIVAYAADVTWRRRRAVRRTARRGRGAARFGSPLADGVVVQDGEVVLALGARPDRDAAAPAACGRGRRPGGASAGPARRRPARRGGTAAARAVARRRAGRVGRAARRGPLCRPRVGGARRGRTRRAAGCRPGRPSGSGRSATPVHRHTVDRHCLQAAVEAAALTRRVGRPDLLLVGRAAARHRQGCRPATTARSARVARAG